MSDLSKHTLTINISDRIEWIDKRCGLTEIQKDYITAQMKEAVSEAVQQANGVTTGEKQCNLPVVGGSYYWVKCFTDDVSYEPAIASDYYQNGTMYFKFLNGAIRECSRIADYKELNYR